MSKRKTWGEVRKGDGLELVPGTTWLVTKAKLVGKKGKRIEIRAEHGGRESRQEIATKTPLGKVRIVAAPSPVGVNGDAGRWATKHERAEAMRTPPKPAAGGPWTEPKGKAEAIVRDVLGAQLVAESRDGGEGYYVPPVDVTTVAAHLVLFHEYVPPRDEAEGSMLDYHSQLHANGVAAPTVHWHTAQRP